MAASAPSGLKREPLGQPFDVRFERASNWDGDALAFTDRTETPNGELTIFLAMNYRMPDVGFARRNGFAAPVECQVGDCEPSGRVSTHSR